MLGLGSGINRLSAAEAAAIAGRIPGFTGLLDESYGASAEAAYSVRRLTNRVSVAMTIRRDSDSTETDIGFDANGNIDEAAITAFCTGTTCRVASWKDQSGNDNHAVQAVASNQPTIYTGGALVKENGKVAVDFDGGNDIFNSTYALNESASSYEGYFILNPDTDTTYNAVLQGGRTHAQISNTNKWNTNIGGANLQSSNVVTGSQFLGGYVWNNSTGNLQIFIDGASVGQTTESADRTSTQMYIGGQVTGGQYLGKMQEIVLYDFDQSANRTDIEGNIGDYFTQNTPLLDTYSGAAAAYSLRKLSSSYSGPAIRVRRDNDNLETDINFNVFGELDTVSLAAHCGSNNGYVTNWYDQSSNSNTARQTTASRQPKIYDATTGVVTENGKPIINLVAGSSSTLLLSTQLTSATQHIFAVAEIDQTDFLVMIGIQNGAGLYVARNGDTSSGAVGSSLYINGSSSAITTRDQLSDQLQNQALLSSIQDLSSASNDQTRIGMLNGSGDSYKMFNMQEIIFYSSEQSSTNRDGIHNNMNTFYSIY